MRAGAAERVAAGGWMSTAERPSGSRPAENNFQPALDNLACDAMFVLFGRRRPPPPQQGDNDYVD
jgi:hypothetical protein